MTATSRRPKGHAKLGVITIAALVVVCGVVFSGTLRSITQPDGETVRARFASTARLSLNTRVRVRGVDVGRVSARELDPGGRTATVTLVVDRKALPLYGDATAAINWRTVLGGNYQVILEPGSSKAGPLGGGTIPTSRTSSQVEVDELLATFRTRERAGIRTMLTELPQGLADAKAPRRALQAVSRAAPDLAGGIRALRGERSDDLPELIANTAKTVAALDAGGPTMTDVIEGGAVTTGVTARREADVRETILRSAALGPDVRTTVRRLQGTLRLADPVLAKLNTAAPTVAPTLVALRPTLLQASALLADARPLLADLRPSADALASAAKDGLPLLRGVGPALARADETILPDLAKPDRITKRPTYQMIGSTVSALDAAAGGYDPVSHFVALTAGAGERAVDPLPCRTYFGDPASPKLVACQQLSEYLPTLLGALPQSGARKAP